MKTANSGTRDELMAVLRELCDTMPEMRFGQLIVNLSYFAREPSHQAPWDVEDDELLAAARKLLAKQQQTVGSE